VPLGTRPSRHRPRVEHLDGQHFFHVVLTLDQGIQRVERPGVEVKYRSPHCRHTSAGTSSMM
jgi:hypothetical protein